MVFRRRVAIGGGAISVGLFALIFATAADDVSSLFLDIVRVYPYLPLLLTPLGFVLIAWATKKVAPDARGSGIPQIIAAKSNPTEATKSLMSLRTAAVKSVLTLGALLCGASVGREGPTVQLAAAVMAGWHRLLQAPMRASMVIAGGAAGVAAAFNTPLAGIAFAIEELAAAYEQRMTLLVMTAILISGMVAQGVAGDYIYFGVTGASLPFKSALVIAPLAGVVGGIFGGAFSRLLLLAARADNKPMLWMRRNPMYAAGICGAIVAVTGVLTNLTWGTGYAPARAMIEGVHAPLWFGLAKFITTAATAISGLPGGIFAPSLATGAGFGNVLRWFFPGEPGSAVVLLGMTAYFTGVVRAPLTAVIIISETTVSRGLMLPMLGAALIADQASQWVCRDRLYHALSATFATRET
ncbi:chloride channel protein [Stakelama pacifica]|uniref:H+/Cl-antiporter ClcA n=1 Tax=Stakelama pacifica TaxID=517720 RepID=A0A4R6FNJ3_9SPHN|nr:chloride channel protein [Stakelama pacifica]TDN82264.1 H+/Cl- antiporter ClcA [Stakelama pacifica]GGO95811.1 chloride channel protein [Stakelama pacifica]